MGGFWELWTLLGALGALLELFLDALGAPSKCEKHFLTLGSLLGRSWEGFGVKFWWFWDGLGLHLGQFGRGFGRDLDALGASWAVLLLLSLAFSSCSCFRLLSLAFSSFLLLAFAFSCFLLFSLAFSCFLLIHRDSSCAFRSIATQVYRHRDTWLGKVGAMYVTAFLSSYL